MCHRQGNVHSPSISQPLLRRPILQLLVLDPKTVLERAIDRFGGKFDFVETTSGETESNVSRFMENAVFHSHGGADDVDSDDEQWMKFGEGTRLKRCYKVA